MPSRTEKGFQVINGLMLTLGWVVGAIVYSALKAQAGGVDTPTHEAPQPCEDLRPLPKRKSVPIYKQRELDPTENLHLIEEARDLADRVILMQQEMGVMP